MKHLSSVHVTVIPVYRQSARSGRLTLLPTRLAVTFPAEERHRLLTSTTLYWLVTEAHRCEQLAQGCHSPQVVHWCSGTVLDLQVANIRSWVQILPGQSCVATLGKLFTPIFL